MHAGVRHFAVAVVVLSSVVLLSGTAVSAGSTPASTQLVRLTRADLNIAGARTKRSAKKPDVMARRLPLAGFHALRVDPVGKRVFVTGNPEADSSLVVFTFQAKIRKVIRGLPGAGGMALDARKSTLYVTLRRAAAIAEIDTRTLTVRRRYALATAQCPDSPTVAGGRVWFGFGCEGQSKGIASLDPASGQVETFVGGALPYYKPLLISSPARPNLLFATDTGVSPGQVSAYSLADGTPTLVASAQIPVTDWTISPDGSTLLTAAGAPYMLQAFRAETLVRAGSYPTGPYPVAAATDSSGRYIAAGVNSAYGRDLFVFRAGRRQPFLAGDMGEGLEVRPRSVAFTPNRRSLVAVIGPSNGPSALVVFPLPRLR